MRILRRSEFVSTATLPWVYGAGCGLRLARRLASYRRMTAAMRAKRNLTGSREGSAFPGSAKRFA